MSSQNIGIIFTVSITATFLILSIYISNYFYFLSIPLALFLIYGLLEIFIKSIKNKKTVVKKPVIDFTKNKTYNVNDVKSILSAKKNKEELISFANYFKNLRGIDFKKVRTKAEFGDFEKTFLSDVDGSWYFTHNQMVIIYKAFSKKNFDLELEKLLFINDLDMKDIKEENGIKYLYGDGFNIEIPPEVKDIKLIMITNEKVTTKSSLEFQTTELTKTTYELEWVTGFKIFDGNDILKKDFQFKNSVNVPCFFNEKGEEYVLIKVTTKTIAKNLIDKIINLNGGKENFVKDQAEGWYYPHKGEKFTIGFVIKYNVVRLNKHILPNKNIAQTDLLTKIDYPIKKVIKGLEIIYDFNKVEDMNKFLHVPLLQTDDRAGNGKMIIIKSTSIDLCKKIVDEIIEKNGGKQNFEDVSTFGTKIFSAIGEYIFQNDDFSILIMPKYPAVRINLFTDDGYSRFEDFKI